MNVVSNVIVILFNVSISFKKGCSRFWRDRYSGLDGFRSRLSNQVASQAPAIPGIPGILNFFK